MDPSVGTLSAHVLLRLLDHVASLGHDVEAFCRAVALHPEALRTPGARIPYALVDTLSTRAVALTGDDNLGLHLAQRVPELVGHDAGLLMLMSSASLRAGLLRMERFQRYWGDGVRATLATVEGGMTVTYATPSHFSEVAQRHADECAMAEMVIGMRALSGRAIRPVCVQFQHRAPTDTAEHEALLACPIAFGAASTAITLADADLDAPLPNANDAYCAIFQSQVERALASLPRASGILDDVRDTARAMLAGGACSLHETARVLGVSARTLQRRLHTAGTSFADLLDALRRELALAYLDQGLGLAEIAFLLGYNEPSAFHHAFKRWTDKAPEAVRKARRGHA